MHVQTEDELLGEDWLDNYATEISDAKYNKTDVNDVVEQQSYLTSAQKKDFLELLTKHSKLFSGNAAKVLLLHCCGGFGGKGFSRY